MKKIEIYIRPERLQPVVDALVEVGVPGMTAIDVSGHGRQKGYAQPYRASEFLRGRLRRLHADFLPKIKIEAVVPDDLVEAVLLAAQRAARTGQVGDGKIFVSPVEEAVRVRTGDRGEAAV